MAIVSFKKLKDIAEKSKETHLIDLGKFVDSKLEGVIIPIRVKSIEEAIALKDKYKVVDNNMTIEYKPFNRLSKKFRTFYMDSDNYRKGVTENTYFQICKLNEDENNIKRKQYRDRLFNILIHFDMEYKTEDGKTLWEDAELDKNDYNGLINIFSDIIKFDIHLDILDIVIEQLKNGVVDDVTISSMIFQYGIKKQIDSIEDEVEKKEFIENYNLMLEQAKQSVLDKEKADKNE